MSRNPANRVRMQLVRTTLSFVVAWGILALVAGAAMGQAGPDRGFGQTGDVFSHPTGVELRLPAGWATRSGLGLAQLVIPGATENEAYVLLIAGTEGARRADDPRVAQLLEAQLTEMAPAIRRDGGAVDTFAASAPGSSGAVYSFSCQGNNGMTLRARTYVVISEQCAVVLLAIGEQAAVDSHHQQLREMMVSTAFGQPVRDATPVGYWAYSKSSSYVSGQFTMATEYKRELTIAEDGTCAYHETSRAIGGDMNNGVDSGTGDSPSFRGTWYANGNTICVVLEGGQGMLSFEYHVEGSPGSRTLTVSGPNMNKSFSER